MASLCAHTLRVVLGVSLSLLAVSFAAIFIRLAEAPALAVALHRNALAAALLFPAALLARAPFPRGRGLWLCVASGVALAFHFGLWISSLDHTSVAASVVLVCTQPIFVALFARIFLGERTGLVAVAGIVLAIGGTALIVGEESLAGAAPLGSALALGGSLAVAIYVLIGRAMRAGGTGLLPYAVVVYATAAVALGLACLVLEVPVFGFPAKSWLWIGAIALGPQILGHTLFNWALKHVKASVLSSTILIEPVLSTLLAWVILAEVPGRYTVVGGVVVLSGLALVLRNRAREVPPKALTDVGAE